MNDTLKKVSMIGAIIISSMACIGFWAALVIAYLSKDQTNLAMLLGIVAGGFNSTLGYWLGSSMGSQKKDELLAGSVPAATVTLSNQRFTNDELEKLASHLVAMTNPISPTNSSSVKSSAPTSTTSSMPNLPPV